MGQRPENDASESHEERIGELSQAYAAAVLSGDEVAAELAIRDAIEAQLTTAEIDDQVIAPALWLVGELWERGDISVADEHLATEISLRVLALQREARRVAGSRGDHRVLLAAPGGELHVVALRMAANLLREAGYDVVMLGADVPPRDLAASAKRLEPDVICLSSTMPGGDDRVIVTMHEVRAEWPGATFVVGGNGLTSRVQTRPGLEICRSVTEAVEAVDALVQRSGMN